MSQGSIYMYFKNHTMSDLEGDIPVSVIVINLLSCIIEVFATCLLLLSFILISAVQLYGFRSYACYFCEVCISLM